MNRKARTIGFLSVVGVILSQLGGAPTSIASPSGPDHSRNGPLSSCWQTVRSRNHDRQNSDWLWGVAGLSSSDVWAVGARVEGLYDRTVGEHWNGTRWTLSLTADVGFNTGLLDVAPLGSADVWAVGFYNQTSVLAEHWDGTGWFINSPIPIGVVSELNGVAGAASADVWAVGFYEPNSSSPNLTLAYHWDGSAWALVTTPNVGSSHNFLNAIDAISSDDVWAVGQYWGSDSMNRPLTEHWDGNQWTVVPSPDVAGARLEGVTALSSSDVWAVGDATGESFAIHWDGSSWTQVPIPSVGAETYLWDVDGASSNDVWAVGYGTRDNQDWESVILHWDGTNWSYFPHPHPTHLLEDQYFYGVASVPGGEAWAVGTFGSGITITYTQRFSAC